MKELQKRIDALSLEVDKLKAHDDLLHERQQNSFSRVKLAAQEMAEAKQLAIIEGKAADLVEAQKAFDSLAKEEHSINSERLAMQSGLDTRSAELRVLKSQLSIKQTAKNAEIVKKHGAEIKQAFEKALFDYMAVVGLEMGVRPDPAALINRIRQEGLVAFNAEYETTKQRFIAGGA